MKNIIEEKIFYESNGFKCCGILNNVNKINELEKKENDNLIVILVHGFLTNKNNNTNKVLTKILSKNNISTFRIDLFGHGESEGKFEEITVSKATNNILDAFKLLKNKGFIRIGLVGSSFGGNAALRATSKNPEFALLALKCPVSDYKTVEKFQRGKKEIKAWKEKGYIINKSLVGKYKLNYSFYEDIKDYDEYEEAKKIICPTIIVHGTDDNIVPYDQSVKLSQVIGCPLIGIKGENHFFKIKFDDMITAISEFIISHKDGMKD